MADPSLPPAPEKTEVLSAENQILSAALQKIADRPHHWTMGVSIAAILVSGTAAYVAWRSSNFAELQYQLALSVRDDAKTAASKQFTEAEKTRKQNAIDSEKDREESRRALDASIAMSRQEQRAWVGVSEVKTIGPVITQESFGVNAVRIVIRNTGRTPAIKLSAECCMVQSRPWREPIPDYDLEMKRSQEADLKRQTVLRTRSEEQIKQNPRREAFIREWEKEFSAGWSSAMNRVFGNAGGVVPPDVAQEISILSSIQWGTRREIKRPVPSSLLTPRPPIYDSLTIYLLGRLTYRDIFNETNVRTTKFCLMRSTGNAFEICPTGNWMD